MRIRTQFTAIAAVFSAILVIVILCLSLTSRQAQRLQIHQDIAHEIALEIREVGSLFNDYLLHGENQQKTRWEAKYSALSQLLQDFSADDARRATLIAEIKSSHERMATIFAEVAAGLQEGKDRPLSMIRVSWSRMEVQTQTIAFNASQLEWTLDQEARLLQNRRIVLLFTLVALFSAFLVINYVTVNRRLLKALADLQAGAAIIGSGDLQHVIAEKRRDEIGDLSRAFNRMTADLREVTASKVELEREIHERLEAEEALRRSESKYRNLFENMTEQVHLWRIIRDSDNAISTWLLEDANPPALASWGRNLDDIKGRTIDEILSAGSTANYLPIVRQVIEEGRSYTFEDYFPHVDRHFRLNCVPLGDYFLTTGSDITALKKTEERLRLALVQAEEGDRLLAALMEYVPEGITMVDRHFNVTRVSRYGLELLGRDNGFCTGDGRQNFYYADGLSPIAFADQPLCRAVHGGEVVNGAEILHINEHGDRLPLLCNAGPIRDGLGAIVGGIVTWRDISDYKEAEEALKRSNRELEQFASVASHDLQEPLRAIVSFLQLLQGKYAERLDDKGRQYIEHTVAAGHRLQDMIRALLNLSRVSTKGSSFASASLYDVVQTVREDLQAIIHEKNADIICSELPTLTVDAAQMRSLFQNLIINGLKYNTSARPLVEIEAIMQKNSWHIAVRDNGIGIAPEFHDRIFEVFQRLHSRRDISGNGMGLALCKKIVERHGGRIWVESDKGGGTTFHFTLPRSKMMAVAEREPTAFTN